VALCGHGSFRCFSWLTSSATSIPSATGDARDVCYAIGRDITARRLRDERLHFHATLLDAVGQAIIATDLAGTVTYWGRAAETLFGWPAAEALGRSIVEVTAAEPSRAEAEAIMAALRDGRSWSGEFLLCRRDGSEFTGLVVDTPVRDASGTLVGIIGATVDMTEQRRMADALRASEARYRAVLAQASDPIYVLDSDSRFVLANHAFCALVGYTRRQLEAMRIGDFLTPADRALVPQQIAQLRRGALLRLELPLRRSDGSFATVEVSTRMLDDGTFQGIARDITERRRAEAELRASQARLQLALEAASMQVWERDLSTDRLTNGARPDYGSFVAAVHPDDRERVVAAVEAAVASGGRFSVEYRLPAAQGDVRWYHATGNVIVGEHGAPARPTRLRHEQLRAVPGRQRDGPRDERCARVRRQRRGRRGAARDRHADGFEELLLPGGRAHAEQPRRRVGHGAERVRRVGGDVDRLAGARARRLTAEGHLDLPLEHGEHLLEVVSVRRRTTTGRHVHVDQRVAARGVAPAEQDRVGATPDPEMRQPIVGVGTCDREPPPEVVGRHRRVRRRQVGRYGQQVEHDLPRGVPGSVALDGRGQLRQRRHLGDRRPQRATCHVAGHASELVGVRTHREPHATTTGWRPGQDVGGDRADDDAVWREHGPGTIQRLAADQVEHQIDVDRPILEPLGAVVDHHVGPERQDVGAAGARGGREHPCTGGLRQLDGQTADGAGGTVDQHRAARSDAAPGAERLRGREHRDRERRGLDVAQRSRRRCELRLVHHHEVGVGAEPSRQSHDAVTDGEPGDAASRLHHDAGELEPQRAREAQGKRVPQVALADLPVEAVHARGGDLHAHLTGAGCRDGHLVDP
jgi:PAS domain S-box-containing protein